MNEEKKEEELLVASDVCEEYGFARNAKMLRDIAKGNGQVFMVVEKGYEYGDDFYYFEEHLDKPTTIFQSKQEAICARDMLNANSIRNLNPFSLDSEREVPFEELEQKISEILGERWQMPEFSLRDLYESVFPAGATDEQLNAIAKLLNTDLYQVVELKLGF